MIESHPSDELYRWTCDKCAKRGMWVRDEALASKGSPIHQARDHGGES